MLPSQVPIAPQNFLTLNTPAAASPSTSSSVIVSFVYHLRQRFWKEGYNNKPGVGRMPGSPTSGTSGAGGAGSAARKPAMGQEEIRGTAAKILGLLEIATEWGCEEAWGTRGSVALVSLADGSLPSPGVTADMHLPRWSSSLLHHSNRTSVWHSHLTRSAAAPGAVAP